MGLYGFSYCVDDMIERYVNADKVYAYDNIVRGIINGVELEMHYLAIHNFDVFGHAFYYKGKNSKSAVKEALNDVPAPRFLLGSKLSLDRLWFEATFLHSFKKFDPGPAELANDAYDVLDIKGGYYFSSRLFLYVKAANILNRTYYANADPDIPLSKGFNLSAGIHLYF
jgi:outer membrane receptor protein involved in Fe transport